MVDYALGVIDKSINILNHHTNIINVTDYKQ